MGWMLLVGFVLGVRHALEADHIAAVSALALRFRSRREVLRTALSWSTGHAAVLIVCGVAVISLGLTIPPPLAALLDAGVGVMLVILGIDVVRPLWRGEFHFHTHHHPDGVSHFHGHLHRPHAGHSATHAHPETHEHPHARPFPRAFAVGAVHGLAGSAAVVLLSLERIGSVAAAAAWVCLFAAGSILGMMLFAAALATPATRSLRASESIVAGLRVVVGVVTAVVGLEMLVRF